jgi:Tfp pilus assembly protein PilE
MRCKNCGTENDDNRYICENCGSPLYDEEDFDVKQNDNQKTQTFGAITEGDSLDLGVTPELDNDEDEPKKTEEKKSIIVIAILVVVLIAIIASIIVVAQSKSANKETTTASTTILTTASTTEKTTTKQTTTKQTTTQATTETTTQTTTTQAQSWSIKLVSKGGGTVNGAGTYTDGSNVTITATPDDGYEFDGWYSNGAKISSTQSYSFTASEDISITAMFNAVTTSNTESEILEGDFD